MNGLSSIGDRNDFSITRSLIQNDDVILVLSSNEVTNFFPCLPNIVFQLDTGISVGNIGLRHPVVQLFILHWEFEK